jgi:hypothetical protein
MTIKILSPCDGDHYVHVGNTFEKMLVRRQQKLKFFLFFLFSCSSLCPGIKSYFSAIFC